MTGYTMGDFDLAMIIGVGTYFCFAWLFHKADRNAESVIKADADGTIKKSREKLAGLP
jgi:hypothetical protein